MSNKKGRDINDSLKIMEKTLESLKAFAHMPLKKGLSHNKIHDDQLIKLINNSSEEAFSLINKINDLRDSVRGIKPQNINSRFAKSVVSRFLEDTVNNLLIQSKK